MHFSANILDLPPANKNPLFISAISEAQGTLSSRVQLKGGFALAALDHSDGGGLVQLYPQAELKYYVSDGLTLFAWTAPGAIRNSARIMLKENPYLDSRLAIRHQEVTTDFTGGVSVRLTERARGRILISFQRSRNYPAYVDADRDGMWEVSYDGKVRILALTTDATLRFTENDRLTGSIRIVETENSLTGDPVPYIPSTMVLATYDRRIASGLSIQGSVRYVGSRTVDPSATRRLKSYIQADVRGEYYFSRFMGLYLSVENLFDEKYSIWEDYTARPFYVEAGLTVKWGLR